MKLRKASRSVMNELTSKKVVKEGLMAELDILAQESNSYQEFEQKFKEEYSEGQQLAPEEKELLQQLYDAAKSVKEARKTGLLEVFSQPIDRAVVTMICEVASEFGVQKLPKKQWSSTTKLVRYLVEKVDKKDRIEFVKTVKNLRESMGADEYIINL
jgi:hypothetical protein